MSFIDDMDNHHLSLLNTLDGREIIYSPQIGSPRSIIGMMQEYSQLTSGETVDMIVSKPTLSIRTIDITEIQVGDQFTIDSKNYEVAVISPDNEGITELTLEKI